MGERIASGVVGERSVLCQFLDEVCRRVLFARRIAMDSNRTRGRASKSTRACERMGDSSILGTRIGAMWRMHRMMSSCPASNTYYIYVRDQNPNPVSPPIAYKCENNSNVVCPCCVRDM